MAGSRIPFAGQMDYINPPSDDDLHGIAHRAAFCSRMPLGMDDRQQLQQNRIDMEISRLSAELTKTLNEILAEVRADAQLKDNLLDEYSIFGQSMIYLGAAMDGAWESIEGYGETLFDMALFIGRRIDPFSGHETLREDMKNMESFVRMSRDKIVDLDITDEDLILYYQLVRDGQIFDKLLDFSKAYITSLSSVDQVRMSASLLPDLLLVFVTRGLILPITGISKARHLKKIQDLLRNMGRVLQGALHRRKTQRRNFGGGPGEGSSGNSLSSPTSRTTENTLPPPARRRTKSDNTQDTASDKNDKIDGGVKNINPNKTVGGRKIINSDLAGKTVKTKGGDVKFDNDGFPDFTPNSKKTVRIDGLTGDMANDVPLAMEKAGLKTYDKKKYVWHHHQDGKSMMLVPRDVHSVRNGGVAHTGGRAVIEHNKNNPTNPLNYPSPPEI